MLRFRQRPIRGIRPPNDGREPRTGLVTTLATFTVSLNWRVCSRLGALRSPACEGAEWLSPCEDQGDDLPGRNRCQLI